MALVPCAPATPRRGSHPKAKALIASLDTLATATLPRGDFATSSRSPPEALASNLLGDDSSAGYPQPQEPVPAARPAPTMPQTERARRRFQRPGTTVGPRSLTEPPAMPSAAENETTVVSMPRPPQPKTSMLVAAFQRRAHMQLQKEQAARADAVSVISDDSVQTPTHGSTFDGESLEERLAEVEAVLAYEEAKRRRRRLEHTAALRSATTQDLWQVYVLARTPSCRESMPSEVLGCVSEFLDSGSIDTQEDEQPLSTESGLGTLRYFFRLHLGLREQ